MTTEGAKPPPRLPPDCDRALPRSPMALPGGTSVQGGEDGPHDEGQREDQQVNHDPSRGIWLAWLIVSHDRSSSLALRYRSVLGACRAGAEHLVQGRGSMVRSEEWLSSMARRVGHLVVRRTAHVADDLPAEPAGYRGYGRIGGCFYANVSMSISLEALAGIGPVGLGQFDSLRRWGALALLGRCPAGAVTSSPDVLLGGVVCWSCCCGAPPAGHFPMAPIVSAAPIAVVSPPVGSWAHAGMRWRGNSYRDSTLRVTTSHRRPPSVDLIPCPASGAKRGT